MTEDKKWLMALVYLHKIFVKSGNPGNQVPIIEKLITTHLETFR